MTVTLIRTNNRIKTKHLFFLFFFFISLVHAQNFETVFEKSKGTETATYEQTIKFYRGLATHFPEISIQEIGMTDAGKPLHLVIFNEDNGKNSPGDFESSGESKSTDAFKNPKNKNTILINNGIHPGESDGIDASMMLLRDLVQNEKLKKQYKNIIIYIIPIYNIGGSLNRNSSTRTNQNGPASYGFRGNARNFDLNRDFIKNDTKNAQTFAKIFHLVNPDVFIDNHVSNGADYQYVLTHLFTQHNKLGGDLGDFLLHTMMPEIVNSLKDKNLEITPYVNVFNRVPDNGFSQFLDSPRYSTGYTTLFNTLGFMVETHMLKPYKQRVYGTYEIMLSTLDFLKKHGNNIKMLKNQANKQILADKKYPIQWGMDSTKTTTLNFKGYEGKYIKSDVTGLDRLKFDRSKPFSMPIKYYDYFKSTKKIEIPNAYVIPQGWWNIKDRLDLNKITYHKLQKDSLISVEVYHIENYKTRENAFEGHYLHYNTEVIKSLQKITFYKGDIVIPTNQNGLRYLIETLEPEAPDSFFNWNFFDTILQQKEEFSPYVFEDLAIEILKNNTQLKADFEKRKKEDTDFAKNWYAQLDYIHKHSKYYEKAHLQYPVYRILN